MNNKIDKEINEFYNNLNLLLKDNNLKNEVERCNKILVDNNYDSKKLYNIYKKEEVDYIYIFLLHSVGPFSIIFL